MEVSTDGDSLLSFCAEGEQTLEVAARPASHADTSVPVRRACVVNTQPRKIWIESVLLFVSGLIAGALVAAALSIEWPERADALEADGESPPDGTQTSAVAPAVITTPPPIGISSPAASTPSSSVAKSADRPNIVSGSGFRGTLVVSSQPRGASIFLNDRLVGRTPLRIGALPAGSRAVRLRLDGYQPWSRGVNIVANRSTTVSARLTPDKTRLTPDKRSR